MRLLSPFRRLFCPLALLFLCASLSSTTTSAQFLFTYEINQEDDSRAPKSSLFDPSAFKIVTPSQLQSSYQKLSSQLDSTAAAVASSNAGNTASNNVQPERPEAVQQPRAAIASEAPQSLLKQTSAALQSFAELFNFSPSSSPSPLDASALQQHSAALEATSGNSPLQQVDQQAEARSLHEHWTQQQEKSHQQPSIATAALNSFTTTPTSHLNHHQQHHHHHQQQQSHHQPQPSQASYWLTASPLNTPDGNYLVQIKQPEQTQQQPQPQQQLQSQTQATLVDNLLSVGHHRTSRSKPTTNLAQNSFLSTPTSYYPTSQHVESSTRPISHQQLHHQHNSATSFPESSGDLRVPTSATNFQHTTVPSAASGGLLAPPSRHQTIRDLSETAQLQPPANIPENFAQSLSALPALAGNAAHIHKSAEDTLISYRQQQQQHDQQSALFAAQQQLAANQQHQNNELSAGIQAPAQATVQSLSGNGVGSSSSSNNNNALHQAAQLQPQPSQRPHQMPSEIPKVSPHIYESFLLQQKDQHEKHMELLKQQQELNKLLEQKHKQQEAELKRKRKKEELDKEARKKALREQEAARKLRLEQEEREQRRKRDEEERRRQVEEQRRYREYLEAREREQREKEAKLKRQKQAEEELKLRMEREREAAELEERRKRIDAEEKEKRDKEAEQVKYANYLRQQEELKKLLELKRKEDEAQQQRRRQAAAAAQQQPQRVSQASRAGRLAQEHKERASSASWGTPIRSRSQFGSSSSTTVGLNNQVATTSTTQAPLPVSSSTSSSSSGSTGANEQAPVRRQRGHLMKKQRTLGDEKLIRQKIPLYSGPGQYGLYRGGSNDSIAQDLAALLDSVTLPSSTTTSTTPAPISSSTSESASTGRHSDTVTPGFAPSDFSSSLSPLLDRSSLSPLINDQPSSTTSGEPFFDDDVPRRPARGVNSNSNRWSSSTASPSSPTVSRSAAASTSSSSAAPTSLQSIQRQARPFNESTTASGGSSRTAHIGLASLPPDSDNDGIPGRAGVEYPVLSSVPSTSFSCSKQPLNGYYADTETACQVVHLCQGGVQSSILCPNGTIFNQEKFSCQWWYEVNCSRAPIFYQLNDNLYKALPGSSNGSEDSTSDISKKKEKQSRRGDNNKNNLLS